MIKMKLNKQLPSAKIFASPPTFSSVSSITVEFWPIFGASLSQFRDSKKEFESTQKAIIRFEQN